MVSQVVCSHVPLRCHQTACQKITRRHRARALTQSPREGGRLHHRSLSPGHRPARWGPAPTPSVRVAQGLCSKDFRLPRGVTRVGAFRAAVCVNSGPASLPLSSPRLLHPSGCHFSYPSRVRTGGLRSEGPRAGRLGRRTSVSSHVWGWASAVAVWVAVYLPRPRGAVPLHVRVRAS